ncbi:MAG: molybdopterin-binding/glycosyltransferase family 2 protein [Pseudomonadota bacterium]
MKFGSVPLEQAFGAIVAHSVKLSGGTIRKGTKITEDHLALARAAGLQAITVARLDAGDMHEDEAAAKIAEALAGSLIRVDPAFTGRANLFSEKAGILLVDAPGVDAINRVDPAITFATLAEHRAVEAGRMVATVKIIPYAVQSQRVYDALHALSQIGSLVDIMPFRPLKVGVISTLLASLKPTTVDKTLRVIADRLAPAEAPVIADLRVPHEPDAVARAIVEADEAGAELFVLFGASAVVDRADVLPDGLERSGGMLHHFGMPVDPGNLLLIGSYQGKPVIGAPGCARSPKENGFDWVLERTLAGLNVTGDDIVKMGVGGLLMEIVSRPQPRDETPGAVDTPRIAALVLAAGRSSRMGPSNKLLARLEGKPLVRHAVDAALVSRCVSTTIVVGHEAERVRKAVSDTAAEIIENPNYAHGLSTSLKTGLEALGDDIDGVIVLLGDMPRIEPAVLDRLIGAYDPAQSALIVVPTFEGRRGNPVLWSRRYFAELMGLSGDVGARALLAEFAEAVVELEIGAEVVFDIDTPEVLADAGGEAD